MTVNRKAAGTASSVPGGLAAGAVVSMGITLLASALTAWLILGGRMPVEAVGYCAMIILLLSSAAGAAVAIGRIRRCRFQICMAAGIVYYVCLLSITALFFGGIYDGMGVTALMVLCGSGVVILAGSRDSGRRRSRRVRHYIPKS